LSDKIVIEEVNFILEGDRAGQFGIDRVPAVAIAYEDEGVVKDSRIRFLGMPAGYEFISLVHAILLVGGRESILSAENRVQVAAASDPTTMQVFITPT
jgi:alkyl hydroperoxide reductase subunit AhpF